jgi:Zn-dependent peptidase ImmA (M78 family)
MGLSVASTYEDPRAHAVRERYLGLYGGEGVPVPVEAIAEDLLGLRIDESWDIDCSGMLFPLERRIVVNAAEAVAEDGQPIRRRRFTIAHEIGHWVCHVLGADRVQPVYCRATDLAGDADRRTEREANVFAAELLMPAPAVENTWEEHRDDVVACAARFGVSPTAMQWRLYSFGLVKEKPTGE